MTTTRRSFFAAVAGLVGVAAVLKPSGMTAEHSVVFLHHYVLRDGHWYLERSLARTRGQRDRILERCENWWTRGTR